MGGIKSIIKVGVLVLMVMCVIDNCYSQDKPETPKSAAKTSKALKKKQWEKDRKIKRETDKVLKAHMQHQTKAVRKRMKADAKKSEMLNGSGH